MLAPEEFTVGTFHSAPLRSLILPRSKHEAAAIVGILDDAPTVVFLSDQFQFSYFPAAGAENWSGLIVPNVRIEVDETTAFDPGYGKPLGAVIRVDTSLSIYAKTERSFGRTRAVPLIVNLPAANEGGVGFTKWQVVLGAGVDKQILLEIAVNAA
ncbi:hypothetical protein [Devosia sp. A449]